MSSMVQRRYSNGCTFSILGTEVQRRYSGGTATVQPPYNHRTTTVQPSPAEREHIYSNLITSLNQFYSRLLLSLKLLKLSFSLSSARIYVISVNHSTLKMKLISLALISTGIQVPVGWLKRISDSHDKTHQ